MSYAVSPGAAPSRKAVTSPRVSSSARYWFTSVAVVAWTGLVLQAVVTIGNVYPATGGKYGEIDYHNADGLLGAVGRTLDFLGYFTTWANLAVAVVATLLALDPGRDSRLMRAGWMSALMMIVVTALVQALILGPGAVHVGWQVPINALMHQITPVLAVLAWLVAGPRRWMTPRAIPLAIVVPLVWIGYTLVRGTVISAYPYGFINVINLGYATVLINITGVVVLGIAVCLVLWGVDVAVSRWSERRRAALA